ncbi:hypothetical protein Ddc_24316 [Ditylenchus destructor]|nr:hypothetical protein Ddc_24316 [Ditylenchus destructor]
MQIGHTLGSYEEGVAALALAGSALTMDQALRNLVKIGLPISEASQRLSQFPADYLGLEERGRLQTGSFADCVRLDRSLTLTDVMVEGKPLTSKCLKRPWPPATPSPLNCNAWPAAGRSRRPPGRQPPQVAMTIARAARTTPRFTSPTWPCSIRARARTWSKPAPAAQARCPEHFAGQRRRLAAGSRLRIPCAAVRRAGTERGRHQKLYRTLSASAQLIGHWNQETELLQACRALPDDLRAAAKQDWTVAIEALRDCQQLMVIGRGAGFGHCPGSRTQAQGNLGDPGRSLQQRRSASRPDGPDWRQLPLLVFAPRGGRASRLAEPGRRHASTRRPRAARRTG